MLSLKPSECDVLLINQVPLHVCDSLFKNLKLVESLFRLLVDQTLDLILQVFAFLQLPGNDFLFLFFYLIMNSLVGTELFKLHFSLQLFLKALGFFVLSSFNQLMILVEIAAALVQRLSLGNHIVSLSFKVQFLLSMFLFQLSLDLLDELTNFMLDFVPSLVELLNHFLVLLQHRFVGNLVLFNLLEIP